MINPTMKLMPTTATQAVVPLLLQGRARWAEEEEVDNRREGWREREIWQKIARTQSPACLSWDLQHTPSALWAPTAGLHEISTGFFSTLSLRNFPPVPLFSLSLLLLHFNPSLILCEPTSVPQTCSLTYSSLSLCFTAFLSISITLFSWSPWILLHHFLLLHSLALSPSSSLFM